MDGIGNNTFAPGNSFSPGDAPSAPPPPPEVKVRTMRSDLESMAKSGGGLPRFESVKVEGLSLEKKTSGEMTEEKGKNNAVLTLVIVAAAAGAGLIGYFAYRFLFAGIGNGNAGIPAPQVPSAPSAAATATVPVGQNNPVPPPAPASSPTSFVHASLFKKPADQTLAFTVNPAGTAASAADLQTFNQKLSTLLATAAKSASFVEISAQTSDGHGVAIGDLLSAENAVILDPQFFTAHFNPDATFFAYRDRNGFAPGYVIALKINENWLFLQNSVANLETSGATQNFFLQNPGTPAANGFATSTIGGVQVRELGFSGPSGTKNNFLYGWSNGKLIISASEGGFAQAVSRL